MVAAYGCKEWHSNLNLFRRVSVLLLCLGVTGQATAWTVGHSAMRGSSGPVNQHLWTVDPQGASIRDIHVCLESVPNDKVDSNGDGSVSAAENRSFEADLLDDWETPRIRSGPGDNVVNWNFSVTRNPGTGQVCLNFYGSTPLPANEQTRFDLRLKSDSNHFEKGNTAASVTYDDAVTIATSDGDQSTDSPIPNGTRERVGGPIVLAAITPDATPTGWTMLLALAVLLAAIFFVIWARRRADRAKRLQDN